MSPCLLLIHPSCGHKWVIWDCGASGATVGCPGDTTCLCSQPHFSEMRFWCLQIVLLGAVGGWGKQGHSQEGLQSLRLLCLVREQIPGAWSCCP